MSTEAAPARPNEEVIRLLRADRQTAMTYRATHEENLTTAQASCDECTKEIKRMIQRIEAIDRAIETLGGKPQEKSDA